ncbi:hypothetical protein CI15_06290 [Paraburkholderia monticola]|uniref:Uncharacterized protein n=1 Tax=Paraburkholderia monticola TaxID=1399968 RepID=A0A149PXS2_9BURK|nr:hypothetical protein CI15_06290 [Paraburkholderia monticola]
MQLERDGLLESILGSAQRPVYKYAATQQFEDEDVPAVTEGEIDWVLNDFVKSCRDDEILASLDDEALQEGFLDRLLHTDSMRLLSRKEFGTTTKRANTTLTLKAAPPDEAERRELRLDFHVAQFLLDLKMHIRTDLLEFQILRLRTWLRKRLPASVSQPEMGRSPWKASRCTSILPSFSTYSA